MGWRVSDNTMELVLGPIRESGYKPRREIRRTRDSRPPFFLTHEKKTQLFWALLRSNSRGNSSVTIRTVSNRYDEWWFNGVTVKGARSISEEGYDLSTRILSRPERLKVSTPLIKDYSNGVGKGTEVCVRKGRSRRSKISERVIWQTSESPGTHLQEGEHLVGTTRRRSGVHLGSETVTSYRKKDSRETKEGGWLKSRSQLETFTTSGRRKDIGTPFCGGICYMKGSHSNRKSKCRGT